MVNQKASAVSTDTIVNGAQISRSVSAFPIGPGLAYFKVVHKIEFPGDVPANLKAHYADSVQCGFAKPDDIFAFSDDAVPSLDPIPMLRVVPTGFREAARKKGYPTAFQEFEKLFFWKGDFMGQFLDGSQDLDDIVYLDNSAHMLFDRNHEVLPTAMSFDCSNAVVHNGAYHLDKALEVLAKDARVIPKPSREALRRNPGMVPVLAISDLYSCDSARTQCIEFVFAPTPEDMRVIWEKAQSYGTAYPSTMLRQAVFDLDMMGLRAAGAAKYDTFYGSDEPAESSED